MDTAEIFFCHYIIKKRVFLKNHLEIFLFWVYTCVNMGEKLKSMLLPVDLWYE